MSRKKQDVRLSDKRMAKTINTKNTDTEEFINWWSNQQINFTESIRVIVNSWCNEHGTGDVVKMVSNISYHIKEN